MWHHSPITRKPSGGIILWVLLSGWRFNPEWKPPTQNSGVERRVGWGLTQKGHFFQKNKTLMCRDFFKFWPTRGHLPPPPAGAPQSGLKLSTPLTHGVFGWRIIPFFNPLVWTIAPVVRKMENLPLGPPYLLAQKF